MTDTAELYKLKHQYRKTHPNTIDIIVLNNKDIIYLSGKYPKTYLRYPEDITTYYDFVRNLDPTLITLLWE